MSELINVVAVGALFGLILGVLVVLIKLIRTLFPKKPSERDIKLQEIKSRIDPAVLNDIEAGMAKRMKSFSLKIPLLLGFVGSCVITGLIFTLVMSFDQTDSSKTEDLSNTTVSSKTKEPSQTDDEVHELLKDISSHFAGTYPKTVDKETTLTGIRADYVNLRRLIYYYRLEGLNKDDWIEVELNEYQELLNIKSTNQYCSQPSMADFRDINVSLEYNYSDNKNIYLFSNFVSVDDCQ